MIPNSAILTLELSWHSKKWQETSQCRFWPHKNSDCVNQVVVVSGGCLGGADHIEWGKHIVFVLPSRWMLASFLRVQAWNLFLWQVHGKRTAV